jgi:hypothetical protein
MRLAAFAFFATTAACIPGSPEPRDAPGTARHGRPDLEAARELDQQGVRSFREGRYGDAIRYFGAAYRLGAPSSELWNVARSRERMDDVEGAAASLEQYLAQRDLGLQDRAEAERELQALRARPSVLTVTTVPAGALVMLDGKQAAGPTPISIEVHAGPHTLSIRRDGYSTEVRPLEARLGRAVIVSLDLVRARQAR